MRRINYITILFFLSTGVFAQNAKNDTTLNRTVVVEQEYNPDIPDASKINVLPKVEEPAVSKKSIEYSNALQPATSFGTYQAISPFTYKELQPNAKRGYVRLGYGNYGNVDGKFSYLIDFSEKDQLGISAGIDGMKGKLTLDDKKLPLHYYKSKAGINYLHRFDRVDFDVAGNWGLSNFNYHPDALLTHQRFTSGDVHLGVGSTDETMPLQFNVETNLMLYSRAHESFYEYPEYISKKIKETRVYTKADATGAINEEQKIGLALQMDNLFYTKAYHRDYTSLQLNPFYEFANDSWKLHLGANVDFSLGFGKALQASPDVVLQYTFADSYVLYAKATGGRQLNDFRELELFCPYAEFLSDAALYPMENTYEQINASFGFKASPYTGVWFHLFGGYQNLKDDLLQYDPMWVPGPVAELKIAQKNTKNLYAGVNLSYGFKDYFKVSAEGVYRHWDQIEDLAGLMVFKPSFELNFNAEFRPIKPLLVNLGYQYTLREKEETMDGRLNPVNNLHAGASYDIYKGLSAFVKLDNILNQEYQYYYYYPTEGFNFLAGLSFAF